MAAVGPGRAAWVLVVAASVWACGLVVAAFKLPVYGAVISSSSGTPTGLTSSTTVRVTQTLVEVNGPIAAAEMAVPLIATLAVATAFWLGVHRAPLALAWTSTGLLVVFNVLAMLTIGVLMLPVTGALLVACFLATRTAQAAGT